ncbi:4'-phosphopantetheinyl transferase family protein [Streptomyces sp. NPDC055815]
MGTSLTPSRGTGADDTLDVRVWALPVPDPSAALDPGVLDEEERRRAAAFVRDEDRHLYCFAHIALRTVLAGLTGTAAGALRFDRAPCPCCDGPHGRPVLRSAAAPEFSLSHTRGLVVIGVAPVPIGVDAEPVPEAGTAEELTKVLHPAERQEVEAAPPQDRPAVFARLWARKEAYLKGLGTGLGRDLAADDVRGPLPGWHLADLAVGAGHAAAVAVASPAPYEVRLHRGLPD